MNCILSSQSARISLPAPPKFASPSRYDDLDVEQQEYLDKHKSVRLGFNALFGSDHTAQKEALHSLTKYCARAARIVYIPQDRVENKYGDLDSSIVDDLVADILAKNFAGMTPQEAYTHERKTNALLFIGNAVKKDSISRLRSATLTAKGRAENGKTEHSKRGNIPNTFSLTDTDDLDKKSAAEIDAALAITPKYSNPLNQTKKYLSNTLQSQKTRLIAELDAVNGEGGLETWKIALAILTARRVQQCVEFGDSIQELDGAVTMTIARVLAVSESTARRKKKVAYERIANVVKHAKTTKDSWARSLWAQINHSLREEVGSSVVSATFHINAGKKKVTVANVIRTSSKQILAGENQ